MNEFFQIYSFLIIAWLRFWLSPYIRIIEDSGDGLRKNAYFCYCYYFHSRGYNPRQFSMHSELSHRTEKASHRFDGTPKKLVKIFCLLTLVSYRYSLNLTIEKSTVLTVVLPGFVHSFVLRSEHAARIFTPLSSSIAAIRYVRVNLCEICVNALWRANSISTR